MIEKWKEIKREHIAAVDRVAAVYRIVEQNKTPCVFEVKVYEEQLGGFSAYTNVSIIDGCDYNSGVGLAYTEEEALSKALDNFLELLSKKKDWKPENFKYGEFYDYN